MGLLTLGMYYQSPISANSTIYTMIVDSKENNIAFYKKSSFNNKEPNNSEVMKKQVEKIFEGYFQTNKFQKNMHIVAKFNTTHKKSPS